MHRFADRAARLIVVMCSIAGAVLSQSQARAATTSLYPVERHSYFEHGGLDRFDKVEVDRNGLIYLHVARLGRLVVFDGSRWKAEAIPRGQMMDMRTGSDGVVYGVGSDWVGDFAFNPLNESWHFTDFAWVTGVRGDTDLRTLAKIVPAANGFYGITTSGIVTWFSYPTSRADVVLVEVGKALGNLIQTSKVDPFKGATERPSIVGAFMANDVLYLHASELGLVKIREDMATTVVGSEPLGIDELLGLHRVDNGHLIISRDTAYFLSNEGEMTPYDLDTEDLPTDVGTRLSALSLDEEGFLVGYSSGYVAHHDAVGKLVEAVRIAPLGINDMARDLRRGLWVATSGGAFRANFPGPARQFSVADVGASLGSIRMGKVLADGTLLLQVGEELYEGTLVNGVPSLRPAPWVKERFFHSTPTHDGVIGQVAATRDVVHVNRRTAAASMLLNRPGMQVTLIGSVDKESSSILINTSEGMVFAVHDGEDAWSIKGPYPVPGVPRFVGSRLGLTKHYFQTLEKGLVAEFDPSGAPPHFTTWPELDNAIRTNKKSGIPMIISRMDDHIVLSSGDLFLRSEGKNLVPVDLGLPESDHTLNLLHTLNDYLLAVTETNVYLQRREGVSPFVRVPLDGMRVSKYELVDQWGPYVVLGTATDLILVDPLRLTPSAPSPTPLIQHFRTRGGVTLQEDENSRGGVMIGGAGDQSDTITLQAGSLVDFRVVIPSAGATASSRYRIGQGEWSPWSVSREVTAPITDPGVTTLTVQARLTGDPGESTAVFPLEVLPEWHQRWDVRTALTLGALVLLGVGVQGLTVWRVRGQRRKVVELEALAARRASEIAVLSQQQMVDATRDPATHLPNRVALERAIERESSRSRRVGHPFALVLLDVRHYATVVEEKGYAQADALLASVASALMAHVRPPDELLARLSGGQFAALLPEADASLAGSRAEEMTDALRPLNIEVKHIVLVPDAALLSRDPGEIVNRVSERLKQAHGVS